MKYQCRVEGCTNEVKNPGILCGPCKRTAIQKGMQARIDALPLRQCSVCGTEFNPRAYNSKYCAVCTVQARKMQNAASAKSHAARAKRRSHIKPIPLPTIAEVKYGYCKFCQKRGMRPGKVNKALLAPTCESYEDHVGASRQTVAVVE